MVYAGGAVEAEQTQGKAALKSRGPSRDGTEHQRKEVSLKVHRAAPCLTVSASDHSRSGFSYVSVISVATLMALVIKIREAS